jgi:predicted esterase
VKLNANIYIASHFRSGIAERIISRLLFEMKRLSMPLVYRSCAIILLSLCAASPLRAQENDMQTQVWVDWHLAGVSEVQGNWQDAQKYFRNVIEEAVLLPLSAREWYRSVSWLGISRSAARLYDITTAKSALIAAFRHRFSNGALLAEDSQYVSIVGKAWLDSLNDFWNNIHTINRSDWQQQEPIVFMPTNSSTMGKGSKSEGMAKLPMIVALHGGNGNYESFAHYWESVAQTEQVIIIVPPGPIRTSEIENSWDYNVDTFAPSILQLIRDYVTKTGADPNRVYIAGYSEGAQAAIILALKYPRIFRGAIAFAGFNYTLLSDSILERASALHTRIYALSGEWDSKAFLSRISQTRDECTAAGIPFQLEIETGMVHEMPLDFPKRFSDAWSWLQEQSEAMRSRSK